MPRILAPSSNSLRRGSNVSIGSNGSSRSLRYQRSVQSLRSPYHRSSSMPQQQQHEQHMHNSEWAGFKPSNKQEQDNSTPSFPPSLVSSDLSVQSDNVVPSLSRLSLSSYPNEHSSNHPRYPRHPQERPSQPTKPMTTQMQMSRPLRRASQPNQRSFIPSSQIKEEDVWGQFVDVAMEDELFARRSRILSIPRYAIAMQGHSYAR